MTPTRTRFLSPGVSPAAVDLGERGLAGVQLRHTPHGTSLTAVETCDLPQGLTLPDGSADVDSMAEELATFWRTAGFRGRRVMLAVTDSIAIVRRLDLPRMPLRDLRRAVDLQAREALADPHAEAVIDFDVIPTNQYDDPSASVSVMVAAAPRAAVAGLVRVARRAGLVVAGIDVLSLALVRALAPPDPRHEGAAHALIHIGWSRSTLVVVRDGVPELTLVLNAGYGLGVDALMGELGLGRDQAELARRAVGLDGPDTPDSRWSGGSPEHVAEILTASFQQLADALRIALSHHQRSADGDLPVELTVSGEGAQTRHVCAWLGGVLGIPTTLCRPLDHFAANETSLPDDLLAELSPRLAVAMGLALSGDGKR